MKRFLSLFVLCLLLCSIAIADTVTVELDTASIEELMEARSLIDRRIAELSQDVTPESNPFILRGSGTEILQVNMTLEPLSRFVFICADDDAEYTITLNGEDKKWLSEAEYFETKSEISRVMVQSQEPWTIDVSPIGHIDTPFISGNGNYVSDRFVIDSPSIVSVTFDYTAGGGNYWNERCSLVLYKIDSNGSVHADYLVSSEEVYEGKTITVDAMVDIDDNTQHCFWGINCNSKIKWAISDK